MKLVKKLILYVYCGWNAPPTLLIYSITHTFVIHFPCIVDNSNTNRMIMGDRGDVVYNDDKSHYPLIIFRLVSLRKFSGK